MPNSPDEETTEPLIANDRNYYKVEKWTKDGARVERMLYAGSNLDKAREVFASAIYHRPRAPIGPSCTPRRLSIVEAGTIEFKAPRRARA